MHHAKRELMSSRVFHYFRPSLNDFSSSSVVAFFPLFTANTIFLLCQPSRCAWCNGRYFLCSVASLQCFFLDQIDFHFRISCTVTVRLREAKVKIPAGKIFGAVSRLGPCNLSLKWGGNFPQYAQIPVGNDVKSLMQWWCQRKFTDRFFSTQASKISYSDHVFSFPNWSFSSYFFPFFDFRECNFLAKEAESSWTRD